MHYARIIPLLFAVVSCGLAGPAFAWDLTGKKRANLQSEMEDMQAENTLLQQELAALQVTNEQQAKKIFFLEEEVKAIRGKVGECEQKLAVEAKRGTGIKVIFFKGDIIYEIASDAYVNYKAGIRYRSLADPEFLEKLQTFEQGQGGDFEVLAVLQEIDRSNDRMIDDSEAMAFREGAEAQFAQRKN
jgi:hypothetical protein